MADTAFRFKKFEVVQEDCAMKINTDGVLLGAWVNVEAKERILDIGTGSGVIAMMLAQRCPGAQVIGIEIDEASYDEATMNMQNSSFDHRLECVHLPIQDYQIDKGEEFDLIVSNPPFFTGGTLSASQEKSLVRHTVKLPHRDLLRSAYDLLSDEGEFSVVLPNIEGLRFIELAEQYRLYCKNMTTVRSYPGKEIERLLLTFTKFRVEEPGTNDLAIRDARKDFSPEYKALTKDFYLKF